MRPSDVAAELAGLRIGKPVAAWYQEEVARLRSELAASGPAEWAWPDLERCFSGPGVVASEPLTGTVATE